MRVGSLADAPGGRCAPPGLQTSGRRSPTLSISVRVLVADDENSVREALRRALVLEGYEVDLASGGLEALATVSSGRSDVMVLDVLMPDMDGLEVCRRLRKQGDRIPILMLTARDAVADRVEGLEAGADDYLVKPFDLDELIARLRALLDRKSTRLNSSHPSISYAV